MNGRSQLDTAPNCGLQLRKTRDLRVPPNSCTRRVMQTSSAGNCWSLPANDLAAPLDADVVKAHLSWHGRACRRDRQHPDLAEQALRGRRAPQLPLAPSTLLPVHLFKFSLSGKHGAVQFEGKAVIEPEHVGSIDTRPVRDLVEDILEGGEDAFETRRLKYGF